MLNSMLSVFVACFNPCTPSISVPINLYDPFSRSPLEQAVLKLDINQVTYYLVGTNDSEKERALKMLISRTNNPCRVSQIHSDYVHQQTRDIHMIALVKLFINHKTPVSAYIRQESRYTCCTEVAALLNDQQIFDK